MASQLMTKGLMLELKPVFQISSASMCQFYGKVDLKPEETKPRKGARRPKLAKDISPQQIALLKGLSDTTPFWHGGVITPTSPLGRTPHPKSRWAEEQEQIKAQAKANSIEDAPICEIDDPYQDEPSKCILCPRRYATSIRPSWKNPKLLAQFVSPHTGLVYKKHFTGLCQFMQDEVEREVKRAQAFGYMSTKMKDVIYLKDPPLFDPTRPTRKNPY